MATRLAGVIGRLVVGVALLLPLVGLLTMTGGAAASGTVSVEVVDFEYRPATVIIRAGTTVKWTNIGSQIHTVTSTDGAFVSSNDLVPNTTANSHSFTFTESGEYTYICFPYHTFMNGTIIVEPEPTATPLALPTRRPERTLPPPRTPPQVVPPTRVPPTPAGAIAGGTPTPTPRPAPSLR